MSRKTPKEFGLCTHPDVHGFSGQTHIYMLIGLKFACIIFHMFLRMIKETSKDKKWSMGSKESAERQGKGHTKCDSPGVVKSAIIDAP